MSAEPAVKTEPNHAAEIPGVLEHRLRSTVDDLLVVLRANRAGRHEVANLGITEIVQRICKDTHMPAPTMNDAGAAR